MDKEYYKNNGQLEDRIGLRFFSNIVKQYLKQGTLLDFGCGTGFFLNKFSSSQYEKIGYDVSAYAVSEAKKLNPDALFITDPERDLPDDSLNCICSLHVLEHIQNPSTTLSLFRKKLKSAGLLIIVVPNDKSVGKRLKKDDWFALGDKTHVSLLKVDEWKELLKINRFALIKTATDGLWDVPYLKYCPLIIQKLLFYPTAALQIWSKSLFLPLSLGENLILIARKQS